MNGIRGVPGGMISGYLPHDWYWLADDNRVYASARQVLVDNTDATYVAWAQRNPVTTWPRDLAGNQTVAALQDVLTPYNLFIDLIAYAANARFTKASGGVTIAGNLYASDPISRNSLANAYNYAVAHNNTVTDWKLADGSFVQLSEAELENVVQQMTAFVQACFTCESDTDDRINAGTITTQAQVDAAFAAISNVFP